MGGYRFRLCVTLGAAFASSTSDVGAFVAIERREARANSASKFSESCRASRKSVSQSQPKQFASWPRLNSSKIQLLENEASDSSDICDFVGTRCFDLTSSVISCNYIQFGRNLKRANLSI